jgi:hypothetical protein
MSVKSEPAAHVLTWCFVECARQSPVSGHANGVSQITVKAASGTAHSVGAGGLSGYRPRSGLPAHSRQSGRPGSQPPRVGDPTERTIAYVICHPGAASAIIGPWDDGALRSQLTTADVEFSSGVLDGAGEIVPLGLTMNPPAAVGPARLWTPRCEAGGPSWRAAANAPRLVRPGEARARCQPG